MTAADEAEQSEFESSGLTIPTSAGARPDSGRHDTAKAWVAGCVTFVVMSGAFAWFAGLADALGGDGGVTNALVIGLFFAAFVMDKVDPVDA